MAETIRLVSPERLTDICVHLFKAAGATADHAERTAWVLVTTSLRGVDSHGVRLVGRNVGRMLGGGITCDPDIRPLVQAGPVELWDSDFSSGLAGCLVTMERAVELAHEHGVGWVNVRNGNHNAACGTYVLRAAELGCASICISNCNPAMAYTGTVSRSIGNNPMAWGAPGGRFPIVLDMAMSVASGGRMGMMRRRGEEMPEEWIVRHPDPTRRPVQRPFGDYKGAGLAVMNELLTGLLAGGPTLKGLGKGAGFNREIPDNVSFVNVAIDVRRLFSEEEYDQRIRRMVDELKAAEKDDNTGEILMPGERAWLESEKRRREGIPLDEDGVRMFEETAEELGVDITW